MKWCVHSLRGNLPGNARGRRNRVARTAQSPHCLRPGTAASVFLARDTSSPYVDNRPLLVARKPEVREYKAVYVLNDEEIGQFSDQVAITATS